VEILNDKSVDADQKQPLVSVIMNCYNGEKYLREAIDSVYAQNYKNWEIIFWDNQSTDKSADIAKSYHDKNIHYFYAPCHTLLYEARNYAIDHASGKYFAFLDTDDWWDPDKLRKQILLFEDIKVGLVYGNYWLVNEIKNIRKVGHKRQLPSGMIVNTLLDNYVVGLLTLVVSRDAFYSLDRKFDPSYNIIGDFDLVIRLSSQYKISCVQEKIATYRYHGGNISVTKRDEHLGELEQWITDMKRNPEVSKQKMFVRQKEQLIYLKVINFIYNNERIRALRLVTTISLGKIKIKSILMLMLPMSLLLKVRSWRLF